MVVVGVYRNFVANFRLRLILGVLGGLALAGGVAAPILRVPIVGTISYLHQPPDFQGASHAGAIILLASAAIAIVAVLMKSRALLVVAGVASLGELAATILRVNYTIKMAEAQASTTDISGPFAIWQEALLHRAHYEWGIAVIAVGGVMVLAVAAMRD